MLATQKLIGSSEDNRRQEKHCNCKRSNCLKLYCECFASGVYCHKHCNCVNCFNNQVSNQLSQNQQLCHLLCACMSGGAYGAERRAR